MYWAYNSLNLCLVAVLCYSNKGIWWKVEHLGNGEVGYISRNRVVIDYSQEYDTIYT